MINKRSCPCPPGVVAVTNTETTPILRKFKSARLLLSLSLVLGVVFFANATSAFGQLHGAGIQKSCQSPVIVCDTDADCSGATGECQNNHCDTGGLHTLSCIIAVTNLDGFGDTVRVNTAFDLIANTGGPTRNPASGNLQIIAVSGTTTCTVGGSLPCDLQSLNSSVTFASSGYNPTAADPNPLPNQANSQVQDLCNAPGTMGCSTTPNSLQFGASTNLVSGCSVVNKADSTACTDTSPGDCKTAGCESGVCVQTHTNVADSTACTSTADIPGDCGTPGCESGVCVATHIPVADSTACSVGVTGTPNECKTPGCESGVCVAAHIPKSDSTSCTDTTPGDCKTAGCESGVCVQTHGNVADSTACTSTPDVAGDCGTPGCESGVCVATHIPVSDSTPCSVGVTGTPDECKTPGCESGVCVAAHINKADSTTCTDTTPECGFIAGCEGGSCVQNHTPQECGGNQGCTPGFWKNNATKKGGNAWPPVALTTTLSQAGFVIPGCLSSCSNFNADTTLLDALSLQGGSDLCGKAEILLRAAAAAYLNASSSCVEFPKNPAQVLSITNDALASCDEATIVAAATLLDGFNNLGCPLNQQGQCSNP